MALIPWLRIYLVLAAAAVGTYWLLQSQFISQQQALQSTVELATLAVASERLSQVMTDNAENLRVISHTPAVERFVEDPSPTNRALIEPLLLAFAEGKWVYRQLRLLDENGQEMVRIERSSVGTQVIGADQMQDKQGREYVDRALASRPRLVHISGFDLNQEYGQIERPLQPTLRMSMRLQSASGKNFVLVANLRGSVLLKGVEEVLSKSRGEAWMIDDAGYWILHPDLAMRWGAQMNPSNQLERLYPDAARAFQRSDSEFAVGQQRFFFMRVQPMTDATLLGLSANSPEYVLAFRFPDFAAVLPGRWSHAGWLVLALVLLAPGSALFVRTQERARRSEAAHLQVLEATARENEESAWIKERVYQLSLQLSASTQAADMARLTLEALAPQLGAASACLFAYREDRAILLASYGAANVGDMREFGAGEGLVGEVGRTGQERHMTPPMRGYFDMSGGCGTAPAADLRVMPLDVHGRVVGILELAFIEPLDSRQKALLDEITPLLALHLDGFLRVRRRAA